MTTARVCLFSLALALAAGAAVRAEPPEPSLAGAAYAAADPFIGTSGGGHTFPGAAVPFGMVQVSPDTRILDFHQSYPWAAGYRHEDTTILGFSQTHFSGTGHSDLGDVLVMPIAGPREDVRLDPGTIGQPGSGYRSRFTHTDEVAQPGYYAVTLTDADIRAELTATLRVGWERYRFPAGRPAHLLVDLRSSIYNYPGKVLWASLRVRQDGTVTGYRVTRGWAPGRQLYFAMRFSRPMTGHALYDREPPVAYKGFAPPASGDPASRAQIDGRGLVGVFDFGDLGEQPLVVKVAISPVSEDNAILNLERDRAGWDFDATRAAAREAWTRALSVFQIDASPAVTKSFYTALYHTMLAPSVAMDADGRYRGPDYQVHQADGFTFYSTLSLWDTYRAEHPLLTLIRPPAFTNDIVRSLIAFQHESANGLLPIWSYQGLETWCMIGYHAVAVIADAYMKGIRGYPADQALDAMVATANDGAYGDVKDYITLGYVPIDREPEAASKTLEYAFDDWTIAQMAAAMGKSDVARTFAARAGNWQHVFDPQVGFVRPRLSNGTFRAPFDPAAAGEETGFTEGNAWQYSWYEPQDVGGLIAALGGERKLAAKLDQVFDTPVDPKQFAHVEDISGLIGYYAHGNEPSHHIAYLYDYAGEPWKTQMRLKQIMDSQYAPTPAGLVGNDDCGQMSAWYIFTALGFYPVAPASNQYVIGRPFVRHAMLTLPNGKTFTVETEGLSDDHPYVGSVSLNGQPLTRCYLRHDEIMAGGVLRFVMQAQPNTAWATTPESRPYSRTKYGSEN